MPLVKLLSWDGLFLGDKVKSLESEFSTHCGVDHAIGTANGLDALTLIFRATLRWGLLK